MSIGMLFALAEVLVGVPLAGEAFVGASGGIGLGYALDKIRAAIVGLGRIRGRRRNNPDG